eukprot:jgi/Ulvmu1/7449/UM036_0111.1
MPDVKSVAMQLLHGSKRVQTADLAGQRVLVRVDFNVPIAEDGSVADWTRVDAALPTVRLLIQQGAQVVLMSHLGRPDPATMSPEEMKNKFSIRVVEPRLRAELGYSFIGVTDSSVGEAADAAVNGLQAGKVLLLENTRFHAGDEGNNDAHARALAHGADAFVLDAFGVCHRDQASVTGVCQHVPRLLIGLLVEAELRAMMHALKVPARPFVVVIGGAKVKDKIGVLSELVRLADRVIIGGRMAYTFLAARGVPLGKTHVEHAWVEHARSVMQQAEEHGAELLLPVDVVCTYDLDSNDVCCERPLNTSCCSSEKPCVPDDGFGADIGPQSRAAFAAALLGSRTVFWNGPMGRYERAAFAAGTEAVAHAVAAATSAGAVTIVGGGDSVSALKAFGVANTVTHVSTGGGAGLALIEGKRLPGLEALL